MCLGLARRIGLRRVGYQSRITKLGTSIDCTGVSYCGEIFFLFVHFVNLMPSILEAGKLGRS